MGAMHAIEITHADQRRPKVGGNVFEFVKDLHGDSMNGSDDRKMQRHLDFELQFHAIIREPHVGRQRSIGGLMRQIMANVRKEGSLRFQPLHDYAASSPRWNASDAACAAGHRETRMSRPSSLMQERPQESRCGRSDKPPSRSESRRSASRHESAMTGSKLRAEEIHRAIDRASVPHGPIRQICSPHRKCSGTFCAETLRLRAARRVEVCRACAGKLSGRRSSMPRMWSA